MEKVLSMYEDILIHIESHMRLEENMAGDCKRSVARHLMAAEVGGILWGQTN